MRNRGKEEKLVTSFDYDVLSGNQRNVILERTREIRERLKRSAQDIWEIGQKLADVRAQLRHGQFDAWLKAEFGWSRRTAYNFINVYEAFNQSENFARLDIATSALYLLAAPSTPKEVRDEFLQRAKEGEAVTHKELNQVIKQEKNKSFNSDRESGLSEPSTPKQEIITIIPQAVAEATKPVTESNAEYLKLDFEAGWYLLEKQHLLFCGDTAAQTFLKYVPFADLAIAITADDWDHDWLVERAKTVVVFPESDFQEQMLEQLIKMFTKPQEVVIFPWLPDKTMLAIAHKLNRKIIAGDLNLQRCREAISYSRLSIEPLA
jgi:hypothetical protein